MCSYYNVTGQNNFKFWWSLSVYSSSREKSQSACLDDFNIPVELCDWSVEQLQFSLFIMWWHHQYLQLKYLFIDTYKDTPNCRVMVLSRVLFMINWIFNLNSRQQTRQNLNPDLQDQKRLCLPLSYTPLTVLKLLSTRHLPNKLLRFNRTKSTDPL